MSLGRGIARGALSAGLLIGGLTACERAPDIPLKPCYDAALPYETENAPLPVIGLRTAEDGTFIGAPTLPAQVRARILGALVKVEQPDDRGTGTLVDNQNNVYTAAHLLPDDLADVTVTDAQGRQSKVVAGCYIAQKGATQVGRKETGKTIDVARLRLAQPIGAASLAVAAEGAGRGDWVHTMTYQGNSPLGRPAEYSMWIVSTEPNITGNIAISGVDIARARAGQTNQMDLGGSGAGVTADGSLVGIDDAFFPNLEGRDAVSETFGVEIPEAEGSSPLPVHFSGHQALQALQAATV